MTLTYFHGSPFELAEGDELLPPLQTRKPSTADLGYDQTERHRIYVTTSFAQACAFSCTRQLPFEEAARTTGSPRMFSGRGWVYEIEDLQDLGEDWDGADFWCGTLFSAAAGVIVRRQRTPLGFLTERRLREVYDYKRMSLT